MLGGGRRAFIVGRSFVRSSGGSFWVPASRSFSTGSVDKDFVYQELFDLAPDTETQYKKLTDKYVKSIDLNGRSFLEVDPEALRLLSTHAFRDIAHLLRPAHLRQVRKIIDDPEATSNDKFVALELLKNANIASNFILPGCQDTGTAIIMGKRGQRVLTDESDAKHLAHGVYDTYTQTNLRQVCSRFHQL